MLKPYTKPALTLEEQLAKLEMKGMLVADRKAALLKLQTIGYYRLSAYWFPYKNPLNGQLYDQVQFDHVISLYEFDRSLRLLSLSAIERIEIAIRTKLTFHMGQKYGAYAHTDPDNFHPGFNHHSWLKKLADETNRSSDQFIKHFQKTYCGFPDIPIWMLTEIMSLGSLSRMYKGLVNDRKAGTEDKKAISLSFNVHHKQLEQWLHVLTYVRNVCAHHSRLWNRKLVIRTHKGKDPHWLPPATPRSDRVFYVLLILKHLLDSIEEGNAWKQQIEALMLSPVIRQAERTSMGMPEQWKTHPIWQK